MELRQFAEDVLLSANLKAKLGAPAQFTDDTPQFAGPLPELPARPAHLRFWEQQTIPQFPQGSQLQQPNGRAAMLHFFANHELMALELMALALLKLTEAPKEFRLGIAETMLEEQRHFELYRDRLHELGFEFGDLPVNDFFWKALSSMSSPIDYVTLVSMTFEQANLDYARYYGGLFREMGDESSAEIMDVIYRDEIGHLAYGLRWFNQWRSNEESLWDAYLAALPEGLSPSWAKGIGFEVEGRKQAGLPDDFIRQLKVFSRSKNRPARILMFNPAVDPSFDDEAVRRDLESLALFVANRSDIVIGGRPSLDFLEALDAVDVTIPEFVQAKRVADRLAERRHFHSFSPSQWNHTSEPIYHQVEECIPAKRRHTTLPDLQSLLATSPAEFAPHLIRIHLEEPVDISFILQVGEGSTKSQMVRTLACHGYLRRALVVGTPLAGLPRAVMRFMHEADGRQPSTLSAMRSMADWLRDLLTAHDYRGSLTVRFIAGRRGDQRTWYVDSAQAGLSMETIGAALGSLIHRSRVGLWLQATTVGLRDVGFAQPVDWIAHLQQRLPRELIRGRDRVRLAGGVLATTDPARAESLCTVLAVARRLEQLTPLMSTGER